MTAKWPPVRTSHRRLMAGRVSRPADLICVTSPAVNEAEFGKVSLIEHTQLDLSTIPPIARSARNADSLGRARRPAETKWRGHRLALSRKLRFGRPTTIGERADNRDVPPFRAPSRMASERDSLHDPCEHERSDPALRGQEAVRRSI